MGPLWFFGACAATVAALFWSRLVVTREQLRHSEHWRKYWENEAMRVSEILHDQFDIDTPDDAPDGVGEEGES